MKIAEKQKKKKKKERKKLLERTWAHFILMKSGQEGVGVLKQIKSLQVEQKEKERKKKKGKMHLQVWTDFTKAGSSNIDCNTMLESAVLTWASACCASCTLLAALPCFFHSRYVRACCDSAVELISRASKGFPSLWSLNSKSPVISTWLSKESVLPGVFVDFSVARGELPLPRYGCWRLLAHELHRRVEANLRFVPIAQSRCPSTSRKPSLKSPCRLQSCPAQELSST